MIVSASHKRPWWSRHDGDSGVELGATIVDLDFLSDSVHAFASTAEAVAFLVAATWCSIGVVAAIATMIGFAAFGVGRGDEEGDEDRRQGEKDVKTHTSGGCFRSLIDRRDDVKVGLVDGVWKGEQRQELWGKTVFLLYFGRDETSVTLVAVYDSLKRIESEIDVKVLQRK
jgi:hypothetical protein